MLLHALFLKMNALFKKKKKDHVMKNGQKKETPEMKSNHPNIKKYIVLT